MTYRHSEFKMTIEKYGLTRYNANIDSYSNSLQSIALGVGRLPR